MGSGSESIRNNACTSALIGTRQLDCNADWHLISLVVAQLAQVLSLKYVAFSGRRSFPGADEAIANGFVARAGEGLWFDLRNVDAHASSVPIYSIGAVKNSDDARRIGDEFIRSGPSKERLVVDGDQWRHERGS